MAHIVVVGGGVVGLTVAIGLQQQGYQVTVIDINHSPPDLSTIDKRVYAINQASINLFKSIQVWPLMDTMRVSSYQAMHVWDKRTEATLEFHANSVGRQQLGVMVEESVVKQALLTAIEKTSITLISDKIVGISPQDSGFRLALTHKTYECDFLVVADGANSASRGFLNIPLIAKSYGQTAIVATVKTSLPHHKTAYQVFTDQGPLAFLPLTDPHTCSIVWSSTKADTLMALSDEAFKHQMMLTSEAKLGEITELSTRFAFPLVMRHVEQYAGPGFAIMGDAAHTIHPLAGLGLNIGLSDVSLFLDKVKHSGLKSSKALGAYHRERKAMVWKMIGLMQTINTGFMTDVVPIKLLRVLGFGVANQFAPLNRWLVENAMQV